jgi:arsenate reductase (thioredoxin)
MRSLIVAILAAAAAASGASPPRGSAAAKVVFVCAHGNVKSLIASEWLRRVAAERGLAVESVARGIDPENPVPAAIAEHLRGDGIDVSSYVARGLAPVDAAGAARLVLIGVEPPAWVAGRGLSVDRWDGIPPASERYAASRDAMRARIETLLGELKPPKATR